MTLPGNETADRSAADRPSAVGPSARVAVRSSRALTPVAVAGGLVLLGVSIALALTIGPADIRVSDSWSVVASTSAGTRPA